MASLLPLQSRVLSAKTQQKSVSTWGYQTLQLLSLIKQSGGTVDVPRFEVPGVIVLGLFRDPAGNPMGLVEMDGDSPRVP